MYSTGNRNNLQYLSVPDVTTVKSRVVHSMPNLNSSDLDHPTGQPQQMLHHHGSHLRDQLRDNFDHLKIGLGDHLTGTDSDLDDLNFTSMDRMIVD